MGARVVEILPLEEYASVQTGLLVETFRKTRGFGQLRRTTHILFVQPFQLRLERRIGLGVVVHAFELIQSSDQCFRNKTATVFAEIRSLVL